MKTVTYPIRLDEDLYGRLQQEAERRKKSLAELFRELIAYGLPALPPVPDSYEALHEVWENLGPAPQINYDRLPKDW